MAYDCVNDDQQPVACFFCNEKADASLSGYDYQWRLSVCRYCSVHRLSPLVWDAFVATADRPDDPEQIKAFMKEIVVCFNEQVRFAQFKAGVNESFKDWLGGPRW
jgi:hypothetical protein